jgi:hypothetical protein
MYRGICPLLLESTLKKELVIENVRAICWIVPKKYLLLLDQTILLHFRSSIDRPLNLPQYPCTSKNIKILLSNRKLTGRKRIAFDSNVHKIAIFSDELENVKQLNFSLQKFERLFQYPGRKYIINNGLHLRYFLR